MPSVRDKRFRTLKQVCDYFDVRPGNGNTGGEDIEPYLTGEFTVSRYAAITQHDGIYYVMPDFDDPGSAMGRIVQFVTDDIHYEVPVGVLDLDLGLMEWAGRVTVELLPARPIQDTIGA